MGNDSNLNSIHTRYLLDEAWSPVARFRLLSQGVNGNTRLLNDSQVSGDRGCVACGNCVDACPVVKQNVGRVLIQNQRTSMSLENFVQEECRRCYRCVLSCPQVGKEQKEYAAGYRRVEKIVHVLAAFAIISLAATGVIRFHYADILNSFDTNVLKYTHRVIGVLSLIIPILYYKLDIRHFRRTLGKIFCWGKPDSEWFKKAVAQVSSGKIHIYRNEFNPAQKIWYTFLLSVFPVIYLTGLIAMFMGDAAGSTSLTDPTLFHMFLALSFDVMLLVHVYIKFIREWMKTGYRLFKNYQETKTFVFTK